MREIRESAQQIVARSCSVSLDERALRVAARYLASRNSQPLWDERHHLGDGTERTVQYLFILDALNFCFWPEPRWRYRYEGEWLNGYLALASALKESIVRGALLLQAKFLAQITAVQLREILAGDHEIPLLAERVAVLREVGAVLQARYDGKAVNLVERAERSAVRLVKLLAENFASFRDEAIYKGKGQKVYFYKRAQIFCGDL